ncbi:uncharacterized protein DUF2680 [Ruminiclostridium sufflavum DSM 19573]|uniref:Uncharacterized protein DUF2680 n=1 Tax=Ruminiclostridium sufflavum DSM 19573 TaxID=1121337 RepID=A0A318XYA0_9FIRM|nr:DUF2680 domain-containing protein [Ruminiclostridium sufflavum]PYG87813.1 uncharacterized protein DUF2680 [Ruminiclostridium sufflavum DSM 19573]
MKKLQILLAIVFITSMLSSGTFAAQSNADSGQAGTTEQGARVSMNRPKQADGQLKGNKSHVAGLFKDADKHEKDPIKRLEERKESIKKECEEGKITKEKADELTKKIDERIAKIKEFNSLPLQEKKDRLNEKIKAHVEHDVQNGKITKEEGDKIIQEFNKQLENWDGSDFPKFKGKCERNKK